MADHPDIIHTASVAPEQAGSRLDKWLATVFPDLSRSRLKALIEGGRVFSDGAPVVDPAAKVRAGQSFALDLPPAVEAAPEAQDIPLAVVYEDEHVIIVDKPAGLVVHPAPGNPDNTLVNALLAHCGRSLAGIAGVKRPGIVHRLDKDTSGLIVAAKSDLAQQSLTRQFAEHSIVRAYYAVVWGVPRPPVGEVAGNIGRSPGNRKKMAVVARGGKTALTRYRVVKAFGETASLVECRLATGRTHQIRVHMASLGHPLVGDQTYGRSRAGRLPPAARTVVEAFRRQALHAYLLGFIHPATEKEIVYESPIPSDINALINTLEQL